MLWWFLGLMALLILSQLLPRALVVGRQAGAALVLAPAVRALVFLLAPITALMRRIGHGIVPDGTAEESIFLSEDGLRFLLNVTDEETVIEDEEKEMIASIFQFRETLVREVMVPRIDVVAVPAGMPISGASDVVLKAGHSRIPVYASSIDNIVGILYARDLLGLMAEGKSPASAEPLLRKPYFVPEERSADQVLRDFQKRNMHVALVVDEYGGISGLVTMEDILEALFGDIYDERDTRERPFHRIDEQNLMVSGAMSIDEFNRIAGSSIPSEDFGTVGGFVFHLFGRLPARGDGISFEGLNFVVRKVKGTRILSVRVMLGKGEGHE
jgi:CBS domain containing-hemolysin-like protein